MIIALTSDIYTRGQMYDIASSVMQQRLSQVDGVGQVVEGGSSLPAVRVEVNPVKLEHSGLGLTNVENVLRGANANAPKGQISDDNTTFDILANDQLLEAKPTTARWLLAITTAQAAIRLEDVAEVEDSVQDVRNSGFADGKPAVLLIVFKQPQANIIDTVDRIREALPSLEASAPPGMHETISMDRTTTIRASVHDVEFTLAVISGLPGHPGCLRVFARRPDDSHTQRGRSRVAHRDIWRSIPAWLQHRQPLAHGDDDIDWLRC